MLKLLRPNDLLPLNEQPFTLEHTLSIKKLITKHQSELIDSASLVYLHPGVMTLRPPLKRGEGLHADALAIRGYFEAAVSKVMIERARRADE